MDAYQLLAYHTTPDSIQSHPDNPQTPPRHPTHGEKELAYNKNESNWIFINSLHPPGPPPSRLYPESLRQPPDTSQTPFRHSEAAGIKRTTWSKLFQFDFYHYQLISHHIPPCQCLGHKLEEKKTSEQIWFCSKYSCLCVTSILCIEILNTEVIG